MRVFFFLFLLLSILTAVTYAAPPRPVIHISKAQGLNADKKPISDITTRVKDKNNVWATIHNGEYVRVTFDKVLGRNFDNTMYARPSNPKLPATIEVYPVYTDKNGNQVELSCIASFPVINHEGFYKITLTKLLAPTKTFDFRVSKGVDIDYIVDPVFTLLKSFESINGGQGPSTPILSGSTLYGVVGRGGTQSGGLLYSIGTDGSNFTILYNFPDDATPAGTLVLSGTTFYGMTSDGGPFFGGNIYSISIDGSSYTDLHDFNGGFSGGNSDGLAPLGSLILSSGTLYGMTYHGGQNGLGLIFSIATTGGTLADLHDFSGSTSDGANPSGSLILSSGTLYGLTQGGGLNGEGIIFSIPAGGGTLIDLHDFSGSTSDGANPAGSLILSLGTLYGMTSAGGLNGDGIIFSIPAAGGTLIDLHDFNGSTTDGFNPLDSLILSLGTLYGMTSGGGLHNEGIIFSIPAAGGSLMDLHDFSGTDGESPESSLILSGSTLYGTTFEGGINGDGIVFSIPAAGGVLTDLHDFTGSINDGGEPGGSLVLSGSTLYGMTRNGGLYDDGIIFSIGVDGSGFTILHSFSGSSTDGANPNGSLFLSGSTLYGTTFSGGLHSEGIIFSIPTAGGTLTDLHDFNGSFSGGNSDGVFPGDSLIISISTLYGVTSSGGQNGYGLIYSISTSGGALTDLHDFSSSTSDGEDPSGSLILSSGTLYGMTSGGGLNSQGIIFSIPAAGGTLTDMHDFNGSFSGGASDGGGPGGALILSSGTLYGMTEEGGLTGDGIIFSIPAAGGTLIDLHDFSSSSSDGGFPEGSLLLSGGTLYGVTGSGGADGNGLLFSMATGGGTLTDLHDFNGGLTDGASPVGTPIISGSTLYGMTLFGGVQGIIYSYLTTSLPSSNGLYSSTDF